MKYCPYCGIALLSEEVSFCSECGQKINREIPEQKKDKSRPEEVKKRPKKTREEVKPEPSDDGYDGYYEDVLPPDLDRVKEGLDKELIKKIVALGVAVVLIIGLCVAMMYLL